MGTEPGVAEICDELGYENIRDIEYSEQGTPMLNSMMEIAEERAANPNLLLISSDIILFQNVIPAAEAVINRFDQFCGVVRKQQQCVIEPLDFDGDWQGQIKKDLIWSPITSGDFFLYPKGFWGKVPEFVIGRTYCDSWLFWEAAEKNALVDLTGPVEIIDYKHTHPWPARSHLERMQNFIVSEEKRADSRNANWRMLNDFTIVPSSNDPSTESNPQL